ncbi:hypothetical protein DFH29DRAFT_122231 [Suillus ampliporus]|nr:hypothetical protein DFH29DRAFT_122231 [Suillus ampliporus]
MLSSPTDATRRKRTDSHSTNEHHKNHERLPSSPASPFYTQPREPNASSHSLRRTGSRHGYVPDNVPYRIQASFASPHNPSAQSSPVTSPSSPHGSSSRFADSQSSFTSESVTADPWGSRSVFEDGNRVPAMSRSTYSGTPPSLAPAGRSRSITESDLRPPTHRVTPKPMSKYPSSSARPRTAPSPSPATLENSDTPVAKGIKFLLSKPALPSSSRVSLQSDSEASSRSRHATPRKSRPHPPELDVSASPFLSGYSYPDHSPRVGSLPSPGVLSQASLQSFSMPTQGREQRQRNVLRRKPSAKAREKMQRELEKKQDAMTASPSPPARGSVFKASPSRDWSLTPAGTVVQAYKQREDGSSAQPRQEGVEDDIVSPSPTPYYTVYGTQSGHTIAAGGPDDHPNWSLHAHVLAEQRAQTLQAEPSRSLTGKGSLTRRVSSRWKKATGGGVKADQSPARVQSNGRPSLQESRDRGQSMDAGEFGRGHMRSATDPQSNENSTQGSKIWKLMKRISTGGLREHFQADTAAPPVPAIPKELLNSPPPQVYRNAQATSQKPYSASKPKSIAGSGPRPSMATSSSSPNSSVLASTSFFHTSHSRGSSVSSYGEETAPLFPSMGDRHIVPPREFNQILGDHTKDHGLMSRSGNRSYSGQTTASTEGEADDQPQETPPRIPTTPITHPIHSLTSLRTHRLSEKPPTAAHTHLLPDGNTSLSPPPRPTRSVISSSRSSQNEKSPSHSTFDEESFLRTSPRAPSTLSEASTAKMRPWSNSTVSTSKDPSVSQLRSAINYRELDAPRRPPLTERQKADIWDDLLERSAQAGGTLHLGNSGELESDNLRFSNYSELSS